MSELLIIVGGGLAGCEAAWQAAENGISVQLYEMRPMLSTGAHRTDKLAELVCSNSLGSKLKDRASGIIMEELRLLNSLLLNCAEKTVVPAGDALAVDREAFSQMVTEIIEKHPRIRVIREEISEIPEGNVIMATGPLTSPRLSNSIKRLIGENQLYFYDAIAPLVYYDSINMDIAFRGSRRHTLDSNDDYINCPFTEDEYHEFIKALVDGERVGLKEFETDVEHGVKAGEGKYFEGCLPVEIIAKRSEMALAYGPMRPVGLVDPRTNKKPYAVVQLRQDNFAKTIYNIVGFQTNLKIAEQKRIFRMIPGLESVEFARFGQMHRNMFIYSPGHLLPTLQIKERKNLFFAGQLIGVEGYLGNIATGLLAGINAARQIKGQELIILPNTTMLGALIGYVTQAREEGMFQPMKANLGLLPPLGEQKIIGRKIRGNLYQKRSEKEIMEIQKESII